MNEVGLIGSTSTRDAFMTCWSIMLVDNDYSYKTFVGKLVYLCFSIWLIIIMLNLLIAIISATHAKVDQTKNATDYKIKCDMLLQMS